MSMSEIFGYDVFICHGVQDSSIGVDLKNRLESDGLRVCLLQSASSSHDSADKAAREGLAQSRTLVLLISNAIEPTEWPTLERNTALFRDPAHYRRRFVPVLLDNVEIRESLKKFAYIDCRKRLDDDYDRILRACQPLVSETDSSEIRTAESPVRELEGHTWGVMAVALSPDGRVAISGGNDTDVHVWQISSGERRATLTGHKSSVTSVAMSRDSKRAVSGAEDGDVRIWNLNTNKCLTTIKNYYVPIAGVAISGNGQSVITGTEHGAVDIWNTHPRRIVRSFQNGRSLTSLSLSDDEKTLVCGDRDGRIRVWDLASCKCILTLEGHAGKVTSARLTLAGNTLVSASSDRTVMVWSMTTGTALASLEGHHSSVTCLAITRDGKRAVTGSTDKTVRVWDLESGSCVETIEWHNSEVTSIAISDDGKLLIFGYNNNYILVWRLSYRRPQIEATRYTNAKVLLVGETGVGKTGLAYRLTDRPFVASISTDGAWATQMKIPHSGSTTAVEKEIWLWDFAGQADYRLIHQLYMDETALAVLVFNPQSEDPFEGLGQWDADLQRAARRDFVKLLVAGRCDRGGIMVSSQSIKRFCEARGFKKFLETSALTGAGCDELRKAIIKDIQWQDIPWTASPRIFKLLKDQIVKLKDEGKVLLRVSELKQQIEMRLPNEVFDMEHLRAVIGLLAGPGVVWQLEFGDFVLLQPERINAYSAAVIRSVRAHTDEIGCISEQRVLIGDLDYQDMERLTPAEEQIILRAMYQTFINRSLCLRENTDSGALLVFPSYFRRERKELGEHPSALVTYRFSGRLDEIYATLVVRLHHTPTFDTDQLWRFAADFKTPEGKRVGIKMLKKTEASAEITVYMDPTIPDDTKVTFIRYVHEHLRTKDENVIRIRQFICTHCLTPVENYKTVDDRLKRGLKDIICVNCEKRVDLWDLIEQKFASEELEQIVQKLTEQSIVSIDNESKELILVGHAFSIAGEAGQIFRPTANSDWGIDGEIEFKNDAGQASGKRIYLQLKSGDSYLYNRKRDGKEIFLLKNPRHRDYWQVQKYSVMLVIRTSDGQIRWMNVTDYLKRRSGNDNEIVFDGEPFTALNLLRLRDSIFTSTKVSDRRERI